MDNAVSAYCLRASYWAILYARRRVTFESQHVLTAFTVSRTLSGGGDQVSQLAHVNTCVR